jgi:AMP-binding enzyme/Phosphopantetheine attachment site/AMP-binding enzyme C-terminal domain
LDAAELRRLAPRARLLNFYGTTETPQAQAVSEIPGPDQRPGPEALAARRTTPLPVGAGIDGAQLIVLSGSGQPAAVGELGEVLIRSRYLSRGYAADPELTARRFAPLPGAGEGGVFRTGDLGRHGPGGAVTLAGRADDQVKVRGFRVELGEVEAALAAHPDVRSAAVTRLDRDGAPALHGYAVAANRGLTEPELLRHLRSLLPQYAVPAGITFLSELPLTNAGKTDRARLPAPRPEARPVAAESDVPTGRLEREILAIWRDVLGMAHAGSTDNFFEIGGHSMAVIEVQSRLKRSLGRQVAVVDLFRFPTIRSLAGHLAGDEADAHLLAAEQRGRLRRQRTAGRQRAGHPAGPG